MQEESYGMNVNVALVANHGDYQLGINYSDTENHDIACEVNGDNITDLFDAALTELVTELMSIPEQEQKSEQEEDDYLEDLELAIDGLMNRNDKLAEDNRLLFDKITNLNNHINELSTYIEKLENKLNAPRDEKHPHGNCCKNKYADEEYIIRKFFNLLG